MRPNGWLWAVLSLASLGFVARAQDFGKDFVECKIELPNGAQYMKGATDPVADLVVKLTLTNKTQTERLENETVTYRDIEHLTTDDTKKIEEIAKEGLKDKDKAAEFPAKLEEFMKGKEKQRTLEQQPVNKNSMSIAYVPPALGPHDLVEFVIKKVPEGEAQGDGAPKPKAAPRDMLVQHTAPSDYVPTAYLAAGATSPEFLLPAGQWYRIDEPGEYTIKAIVRGIGQSQSESKTVESNEERFRVLPYKIVTRKIDRIQDFWEEYERGHPAFEYMFYELQTNAAYREVYYVQKVMNRGLEKWEWHRLCTVDPFSKVQVAQVNPKKVAILAKHWKGDAGLYQVDFASTDPKIESKTIKLAGDQAPPALKVEGGVVSAE